MTDSSALTTRVQLKRVLALVPDDRVRSSLRTYTRAGNELINRTSARVGPSREGHWTVISRAEFDSSGMLVVELKRGGVTLSLWTSPDAYIPLANKKEN